MCESTQGMNAAIPIKVTGALLKLAHDFTSWMRRAGVNCYSHSGAARCQAGEPHWLRESP